jgi:hypothetical protein
MQFCSACLNECRDVNEHPDRYDSGSNVVGRDDAGRKAVTGATERDRSFPVRVLCGGGGRVPSHPYRHPSDDGVGNSTAAALGDAVAVLMLLAFCVGVPIALLVMA